MESDDLRPAAYLTCRGVGVDPDAFEAWLNDLKATAEDTARRRP
ncbi:hypothetical protein [Streptomyces sp. NPDC058623]